MLPLFVNRWLLQKNRLEIVMTIPELFSLQQQYFAASRTKDINIRKENLKTLKKALNDHRLDIYKAFKDDLNKLEFEVDASELSMCIMEIDYFLKHLKSLSKRKKVGTNLLNFPSKNHLYYEPYGVALVIAPWNYPLQLALVPAIGALAAGNTVILKPSEYAPKVAEVLSVISDYFEDGLFSVVTGGIKENQELLDLPFDYIFFTGSTNVGRIVMEKASHHLTPLTLELGGKSPCVVTATSDLDIAAHRITWAKFLNAGQTCVAVDYVYVDKKVKDQLIKKIIAEIRKGYFDGDVLSKDFVHVVNEKQLNRLLGLIDQSKVVFGGKNEGLYLEPTVIDNVAFDDKIMQEEIFGPLLPIVEYDNFHDAVEIIRKMDRPLASYIFSSDKKEITYFEENVAAGSLGINDCIMMLTNHHLPFGGIGKAGFNSYHGKYSFRIFSHEKAVYEKGRIEVQTKYPPYTAKKLKMLRSITKIGKK